MPQSLVKSMNMLKNGSMAIMPEFQFQPNNRGTYITGGTSLDFKLAKLRNEMVSFVYYRNVGISWSLCGPFPSNRSCSANIDSWYTFWMNEYLRQDKAQLRSKYSHPYKSNLNAKWFRRLLCVSVCLVYLSTTCENEWFSEKWM